MKQDRKQRAMLHCSKLYKGVIVFFFILCFSISTAHAQYKIYGQDGLNIVNDISSANNFMKELSGTLPPASTVITVPMRMSSDIQTFEYIGQAVRATCDEGCREYENRKCIAASVIDPPWHMYPTFSCDALISKGDMNRSYYCLCMRREPSGIATLYDIQVKKIAPGEFNYSELGAYNLTWKAENLDRVDVTDGKDFSRRGVVSDSSNPLSYAPLYDNAKLTFTAIPSDGSPNIVRTVDLGNSVPKAEIYDVKVDRQRKAIDFQTRNTSYTQVYANGKRVNISYGNTATVFFDTITEKEIYIIKAYGYGSEDTEMVTVDPVILSVVNASVRESGKDTVVVSWEVEGTENVRVECATSWGRFCTPFSSTNAIGSATFSGIDVTDTVFTVFAYKFTNSGKVEVSKSIKIGGPTLAECMGKGVVKKFGQWETYAGAASCGLNDALKGDFIGALGSSGGCMVGSMLDGAAIGVKDCGFDPNGDASCAIGGARLMSQVTLPQVIPPIPTPLGMVNFGGKSIAGALGNLCGAPAANACLAVPPPPLVSVACGLSASMVCQVGAMAAGSAIGIGLCKAGVPLGENQDIIITALNTITAVVDNIGKLIDFIKDLPKKMGELIDMIKGLFSKPLELPKVELPKVEDVKNVLCAGGSLILGSGVGCAGGADAACNQILKASGEVSARAVGCTSVGDGQVTSNGKMLTTQDAKILTGCGVTISDITSLGGAAASIYSKNNSRSLVESILDVLGKTSCLSKGT